MCVTWFLTGDCHHWRLVSHRRLLSSLEIVLDAGKNGVAAAKVIEECQCVSDCYTERGFIKKTTNVSDGSQEVVMHLP